MQSAVDIEAVVADGTPVAPSVAGLLDAVWVCGWGGWAVVVAFASCSAWVVAVLESGCWRGWPVVCVRALAAVAVVVSVSVVFEIAAAVAVAPDLLTFSLNLDDHLSVGATCVCVVQAVEVVRCLDLHTCHCRQRER